MIRFTTSAFLIFLALATSLVVANSAVAEGKRETLRGGDITGSIPLSVIHEICGPSSGIDLDVCLNISSIRAEYPKAVRLSDLGRQPIRGQIIVLFTRLPVSITPNRVVLKTPLSEKLAEEPLSPDVVERTIMQDKKTGEILSYWRFGDSIGDWSMTDFNATYIRVEFFSAR